jgi:predicted aspartyl protease
MRFVYERYDIPRSPLDGATEIYRPEIPIHLIGTRGEVFSLGLVDTGADSVVLGAAIADQIGVKRNQKQRWPLHGLSNEPVEAVLGRMEIELVGRTESLCWTIPVAVVSCPELVNEELVELKPNASFPKNSRPSAKM